MKKESLLRYGTLASALLPVVPACAKAKKGNPVDNRQQPNVIILYADDLGYGDLECFGATRVQTPNVNALAESGIRLTNVHAIAATSTPSRYGLLTGEYAFRHAGTDIARGNAGMIIRPEQFTMADAFKNAGYATAAIGKWHLGLGDRDGEQDWNAQLPMHLGDIGFDYHYLMAATADRVDQFIGGTGRNQRGQKGEDRADIEMDRHHIDRQQRHDDQRGLGARAFEMEFSLCFFRFTHGCFLVYD